MSTSTSANSYEFLIKMFSLFNNYIDFDLILEFAVVNETTLVKV